jgi:DNA-binding protein YbaB
MTEPIMPSDVMERRGGVVVSIKDSTPTATPESIKARKTVIEILKQSEYDQYRTANEQRNAQLKKLSGGGSCEGVISNHCTINPKDVELLEGMYRAAQEARKRRIESKEYKEKMINLIFNKEN